VSPNDPPNEKRFDPSDKVLESPVMSKSKKIPIVDLKK
jgi:hypothetical protein